MASNTNTPSKTPSQLANVGLISSPSQSQTQNISPFQSQFTPTQAPSQLNHPQFTLGSSPSLSSTPLSAKRPPQKPPVRPPPIAAIPFRTAEVTPASKRKKRKPQDKQLPDRVAALLPESTIYTQLLELESHVDAALVKKKIDIQESIKNLPYIQRTLRVYIFNTYSNQTRNANERQSSEPPSWTLKIIGRILDDGPEPDLSTAIPRPSQLLPKFSAFFKRITIALDPNLYPENPAIVWENSRSLTHHEGFEIKRKGDKEFNVSIKLEMNHVPEKFKLSPALLEVLGIEVETRQRIISGIWHYIKAKKLQSHTDHTIFTCDPPLRKVFGEETMKFSAILQKISSHLSPPQAIHLEHRIRLSGSNPACSACYDILVDVPFPIQREMASFLSNTERHKEIDACDEAITSVIKKIYEHRRRRAFFLGFSQSPVDFLNELISSQHKDLKLAAGDASRNAERERHSDFYNQPWVEDAVIRYLHRKPITGSDAPPST